MKVCTFAGHREVYSSEIDQQIGAAIEEWLKADTSFIFYTGGMGEFDSKCSSAVRAAKRRHPELDIELDLVVPYMSNELNTNKEYYEAYYDGVIIPMALEGVHYKSAITGRNRWMIDRSGLLIAYVYRDFGGAYTALKYARSLKKEVVNLAEMRNSKNPNSHL